MAATSTVSLPDGRLLDVCEVGDPTGSPVLSLHGTTGSPQTQAGGEPISMRPCSSGTNIGAKAISQTCPSGSVK